MEKIDFKKQLLDSIKKDDIKSFTFLMQDNADFNLCIGRFPILSLLYLYSSFKILAKFEHRLMAIHNYRVESEPLSIYKDFRKVAGKSLRFFSGDEIVYPILMLAVLNEGVILKNRYRFLYKNANICSIIENIYNLNHKIHVEVDDDFIDIPDRKMTAKHYVLSAVIGFIFCAMFVFCSLIIPYVVNRNGIGTQLKPIKIASSAEFELALEKGERHYILESDITIGGYSSAIELFSGSLDGANHTLNIEGEISASFIQSLVGSIKNLKIKLNNNTVKITQNTAIITQKNSGKIENCEILGNFTQEYNANDEVFVGLFVAENFGEISDCRVGVSGSLTNNKKSNAYFGLFAGVNNVNGKILNCVAEKGIVIADTVDLAGVTGQNNGLIKSSVNKANIAQTSSKQWHPNVAGIAVSNYGSIELCENLGDISSKSEGNVADDGLYYVFIGGMSCENFGNILSCVNKGKIEGLGEVSNVVAGGISAQNIKDEEYEGVVKQCRFDSAIYAKADSAQVCAGGLVGINSSVILNSGATGSIEAVSNSTENKVVFMNEVDKPLAIVAGGLVGVNQNALIQNCYSDIDFTNTVESTDVLKLYSGVVGSIGLYRYSFLSNPLIISGVPNSYVYIRNNYYVNKTAIKQCAYGVYAYLQDNGVYASGVAESISDVGNESLMKKCASFKEIPEEVRAYA